MNPQLRFPEFTEEWRVKKLSDIAVRVSDGIHATPAYDESGSYYFINGNNLSNGKITINKSTKKVSIDEYRKYKKDIDDNTILMSINGTIGSLARYNNEPVVLGKSACYIKFRNAIDREYIYNFLKTTGVKNYYESELTGSTIKNLSISTIKNTVIPSPSKSEQEKIAEFLKVVDERIAISGKRLELLKRYKKGVMQKIFSKTVRFKDESGNPYPEWKVKRLGELATIKTGDFNVQDANPDGEYTFFDRSSETKKYHKYSYDNEALIYAGEGSEFLPRYFKGKYGLHQRAYTVFDASGISMTYLYYFTSTQSKHFLRYAVGSTVKSLRMDCFTRLNIPIPVAEEQQKITAYLTVLSDRIAAEQIHLIAIKQWKKGLLQRMFV